MKFLGMMYLIRGYYRKNMGASTFCETKSRRAKGTKNGGWGLGSIVIPQKVLIFFVLSTVKQRSLM